MRINNNMMAMNTHRQLGINNASTAKSLEKLSSGLRINRAGDDAAGLAISEKMRGQIRGLTQASRNAQDGISLIQTAEGGLNETHAILQRMRELAVQSANDTNVNADRTAIQDEVDALAKEITRISNTTEFNTQNLLGGQFTGSFQIGANKGQKVDLSIGLMDAKSLGVASGNARSVDDSGKVTEATVTNGINISKGTSSGSVAKTVNEVAGEAVDTINKAIETVSAERSKLGAMQNRLEHTIKNLDNTSENLQAAESRIRDVDMAKEMMEFTKQNILQQAATAMLAQANQAPQSVLQLLR